MLDVRTEYEESVIETSSCCPVTSENDDLGIETQFYYRVTPEDLAIGKSSCCQVTSEDDDLVIGMPSCCQVTS